MELFLAGTLVGVVVSNIWNVLVGRESRKLPPADAAPPRLLPPRKKRRS